MVQQDLEDLKEVVNVDCGTACIEGVKTVAQTFVRHLEEIGFTAELVHLADDVGPAVYATNKPGAERFDGRLSGLLGFFDTEVYGPFEFDSVEELTKIKPKGGGGTSFHSVFRFIKNRMSENPPYCVIILTDGQASFPEESAAMGIPVLWIMTGDIEAPFGKCIKLE